MIDTKREFVIGAGSVAARGFRLWGMGCPQGRIEISVEIDGVPQAQPTIEPEGRLDEGVFSAPIELEHGLPPEVSVECRARVGAASASCRFRVPAQNRAKIGLISCHQPLDDQLGLEASRVRQIERAVEWFDEEGVAAVLLLGDQLYTDVPSPVRGSDEAELRAGYVDRYYRSWGHAGWKQLLARFSTLPVIDDHEIYDNWGSELGDREERRRAALAAFGLFQFAQVKDLSEGPPFDYGCVIGPMAIFVADLRSERDTRGAGGQIMSAAQWERLEAFGRQHADAGVLCVALSVPAFNTPQWAARIGGMLPGIGSSFRDRWSHPGSTHELERLAKLMASWRAEQPQRKVVLASGDIHVGTAHRIALGEQAIHQVISSSVTGHPGWLQRLLSAWNVIATRSFSGTAGSRMATMKRSYPFHALTPDQAIWAFEPH